MKIGILGGTFDPPHSGHLEFARAAVSHLNLDEVIWLPAHRNPLRATKSSPARQRLDMVQKLVLEEPKMAVSDIEIGRGGPSYTVDTLMELQSVKPGDYWLLLGSDGLKTFDQWKNPQKILRLCRLGIALRPPATLGEATRGLSEEVKEKIDMVPAPPTDISSSELRHRLTTGRGMVAPFLSPAVLQYIKHSHLYGS